MARVFAHTDYVLRGYTRLTHEAIVFRAGQMQDVPDAVAQHLTGSHPYEFCLLGEGETASQHIARCPLSGASSFATSELEAPPVDKMLLPRRRGRPPLVRR